MSIFSKILTVFQQNRDNIELETFEDVEKKNSAKSYYKLIWGGIAFSLVIGAYNFYGLFLQAKERIQKRETVDKTMYESSISVMSNPLQAWQSNQEERVESLEHKISSLPRDINSSLKLVSQTIKQEMNNTLGVVAQGFAETHKSIAEISRDLNDTKEQFHQEMFEFQSKIDKVSSDTDLKIENLARDSKKAQIGLPHQVESLQQNPDSNTTPRTKEKEVQADTETPVEIVTQAINFSTLTSEKEIDKNISKTFNLMPGFAKGTLINGVVAPTMVSSSDTTNGKLKPIFISVDTTLAVANSEFEDIQDCLLQGTASGDFSSARVEIRLVKLSCVVEDELTFKKYRFEQPVQGWIFGKDGTYGSKGRLVTKEGEIISKAIPLVTIEAMIQALANSDNMFRQNTNTNSAGSTINVAPATSGAVTGASGGATNILGRLSDIYIEYLNSLKPTIDLKAGQEVTIAFQGGEAIQLLPYEPVRTEVSLHE